MPKAKQGKCEECGKNYEDIKDVCGHCGYSAHGSFMKTEGDPYWKCGNCGRTVQVKTPVEWSNKSGHPKEIYNRV